MQRLLCNKSDFLSLFWSNNPENKSICIVFPDKVGNQVNQDV